IEFRLLGEDPAEHAAHGRGGRLRTRRAERAGLSECAVEHAGPEQKAGDDGDKQHHLKHPAPPDDFHGHFTPILFAYSAPMVSDGSLWSAGSWLSCCASAAPISCGRPIESLQCAGAPTSLTGSFSAKLKSTKNSRS